jgi:acyl-coenzyme A synthetase/AMP-(fatty) acid ligase
MALLTLRDLIVERAQAAPAAPYIRVGETEYSNEDVLSLSVWFSDFIRARTSTSPRNRVGVSATSSQYLPIMIWAAVVSGTELVFVPNYARLQSRQPSLVELGVDVLFAEIAEVPEEAGIFSLPNLFRTACRQLRSAATIALTGYQPDGAGSFVFHTSGTEGEPKLVRCEFAKCLGAIQSMKAGGALSHAIDQTAFVSQPLYHSYGLSSFLEYSFVGSRVVLPSGKSPLGPAGELLNGPGPREVTAVEGVPYFWAQCARLSDRMQLPRLKHMGVGGGPLDQEIMTLLVRRFPGVTVSVRYGLTETPSVVSHKVFRLPYGEYWKSSGRTMPGYHVTIVDETMTALEPNQEGEIVVEGPFVATTDAVLRTGDIGYLTTDGELVVVGRKSVFIKHRGFRVSPEPVESAIGQFSGVVDCRVVARGDKLVAEVVHEDGLSKADIFAFLRSTLPGHCVPDEIVRVQEVPRTYSGKISRAGQ